MMDACPPRALKVSRFSLICSLYHVKVFGFEMFELKT